MTALCCFKVLQASCQPRCLQLWSAVYLAYPTPYSETPLVENGDTSDYGDSVSSACITPVSPTFPNGGIDQEKTSRFCHITESKSDGNLFCKNCSKNRLELDESSKHFSCLDKNLKSRSCPECRTDFSENGALDSGSETVASETTSLYSSVQSDSNALSILSCGDSVSEVDSMTSSTATIILDPSEGESNFESKHSPAKKTSITTLIKETDETERSEEEQRVEEDCNEQNVTCEGSFTTTMCEEEQTECFDRSAGENLTKSASVSTLTGPVQETSSSTATVRASSSELFTRYLDVDGLTYVSDPVQERLRQIEMAHQAKLESLQRQLIDAQRRRTLSSENKGASGKTSDLADEVVRK